MSRHPGRAGAHSADFSAGGRHATGRDPASDAAFGTGSDDEHSSDRALLLASVARDARLDAKFLLLIVLSAAIATLGLLQGSAPVVIGAMLVSPLLGPIMGIGFGLATLDSPLIKRSLVTLAAGMIAAVMVAMLIAWISPIQDVTAELRARTEPTLLDLGVAVVGGIAGVFAILRQLSGVMVGVSIATALVPPLSTIGFGLVTGRPDFALGAALLFLTNTLAIAFAATLVARLNRFGPSLTPQHTALQVTGIVATLGVLSIPLALSLNDIAREVAARSIVQSRLEAMLDPRDRIDSLAIQMDDGAVTVDGVLLVDVYDPALNRRLEAEAGRRLDRRVTANIVQLKQQTNAAEQLEDRLNRRLIVLERRDEESTDLLSGLTVGGLIARDAIVLDAQARRIVVRRDREAEGEQVAAAIDRVMATAQQAHPGWVVQGGALEAVPVTADEADPAAP